MGPTANMDRKLSIVLVSFNAKLLVLRCIKSITTYAAGCNLHISDNDSRDGSKEAIRQLCHYNPLITLHSNNKNLGFSTANNVPLTSIDSELILFLNPDTKLEKNTIPQLISFMDSHPDVGMCGPVILNEDGTEQRGCRRSEPTPLAALKTLIGKRENGINQVGTTLPEEAIEVDAISGAFMMVRKEALDEVGPMDEGYFLHCEDLDWCKRFWLKGWKVMFVPDVSITHFKGGSSRKRPIRVEWHKHKGMVRYYNKFYQDKYPKPFMYLVYSAVWTRFVLMTPIWWLKGLRA